MIRPGNIDGWVGPFGKTGVTDVATTELRGEGVTLRPPDEADAAILADAVQRSIHELAPWMPWAVPDYDPAMAAKWIRGELGDAQRFVIVDGLGEVVGACGLNRIDAPNRSANLGYWIRSDRAGRGHATEATRLLARYGLHQTVGPMYRRLSIVMSTRHQASRRVAEKAGAVHEGTLRQALLLSDEFHDAHIWGLVAGDL